MSYCKYKNIYVFLLILSASQIYATGKSGETKTISAKLLGNELVVATVTLGQQSARKKLETEEGHSFRNTKNNKSLARLRAQIAKDKEAEEARENDFLHACFVEAQQEKAREAAAQLQAVHLVTQQEFKTSVYSELQNTTKVIITCPKGQATTEFKKEEDLAEQHTPDQMNWRHELRRTVTLWYGMYLADHCITQIIKMIVRINRHG